jgi:acyl-CoA reductase-like NAD-dependent aldehyde dehydrogenase
MTEIICISPVDGSVYAKRPVLSKLEAVEVITSSHLAGRAWRSKPLDERVSRVMAFVSKLVEDPNAAAEQMSWMMGRPKNQFGEFQGCVDRATYMASIAEQGLAPHIVEDSKDFERRIEREPHGVVFVVAPWNYPYLTSINTIVPALIAGNTVVMKHAAQTLLVGEHMKKAADAVDIPAGVLQNVFLDHATTSELISENYFDFINFTGSVGGGQAMERASAGTFTGVGTELGGKDPAYVMQDADIESAATSLMDGAFYNSGQCCCGIERIYVHETVYDAFVSRAVSIVSQLKLGNPFDPNVTIGPMANRRFAAEVRGQIAEAIDLGAIAQIPSELFPEDDGGAYLAPQILTNVNHDMRVMREESFGPVVGIMSVSGDKEAIRLMNDSEFGLTASLWTNDTDRAARLGREIETGTVFMNRCDYLDPAICWTGCKNTGRGGTLSFIGYQNLTRPKSYHLKKTI